jgi:hypothetical protein
MCILSVAKTRSISRGELMDCIALRDRILTAGQARINRCDEFVVRIPGHMSRWVRFEAVRCGYVEIV